MPAVAELAVVAAVILTTGCRSERASAPAPSAPGVVEPATAAPAPVATVVAVVGDVRIQRNGGAWVTVRVGGVVAASDTIQAMAGGRATLRIAATGAELMIDPETTMRIAGAAAPVEAVGGRMTAHLADDRVPRRLELALPPGVLVLTTDPVRQPRAEAVIEVGDASSSVEMRVGAGEVRRTVGPAVALGARGWVRFDRDGAVADRGELGPTPTLVAPVDGARLRVRHEVELRWEVVPAADRYRVVITSGEVQRRLVSAEPVLRVPMASGQYQWTVQAIGGDVAWPVAARRALTVDVDDRPPPLAIAAPLSGATVVGPTLRIVGESEPGAVIEAAGRRTSADPRGRFTLAIAIGPGLTNLVIAATDDLGNQRRVSRSVLWE